MRYLKVVCNNIVNASAEVVKWNSWDGEHLKSVHNAYSNPKSLYSIPGSSLFTDSFKIPFLPLRLRSFVFTAQHDDYNQVSYASNILFLAKNNIKLIPLSNCKTKVEVTYEFEANFFISLFFPIIKKMIIKWNKVVWLEDLPLKLRRQKALEYGFKDWIGLPKHIADRKDISKTYKCEIPVQRPTKLEQDNHPFYKYRRK